MLLTCGGVLVAARLGFIGAILGVSLCNLGAGARHKTLVAEKSLHVNQKSL